jgi:type I restriction enzyme S subunit
MTENIKYIETSIGLIPSDWKVKKLSDVSKVIMGQSPDSKNYFDYEIGLPLLQGNADIKERKSIKRIWTNQITKVCEENDIVMSVRAPVGTIAKASFKSCIGRGICCIQSNELIIKQFLYSYLEKYETNWTRLSQGSTFESINSDDIKLLKIPVPPLPEQQKIAAILSTWDMAIDDCKGIIEELKVRNKGLTQKLFNKEFEKKHLSEIFERVTTKNSEKNQNVITISAQRGFIKQTDFFNKIIASNILDHYTLVKKGDFCYNKSYSNGYDWGATKRLNDFEKAVVTTLYICFRLKDENQNSGDFFEYYFESEILYKGLSKVANEGGRAHGLLNVTSSDFFNIKIGVPTFEEQKAIATILDKATEELNQYQQKLQTLQLQKKGLMQQLLTGKVRVKI